MVRTTVWKVAAGAAVLVAVASLGVAAGAERSADAARPDPRAGAASPTENGFVPIVPCRIVNTQNGQPLAAGEARGYRVHGDTRPQGGAQKCGVPASATAVEVNITAVRAQGNGYLRVGPADAPIPNATFLNYEAAVNLSNAGAVAIESGPGVNLQVQAFVRPTHVVVDVLGYYVASLHATVATDGVLVNGSGVTDVRRDGVGDYEIDFQRDVTYCGVTGVPTVIVPTSTLQVVVTAISEETVYVHTVNGSGTPVDAVFSVTVVC